VGEEGTQIWENIAHYGPFGWLVVFIMLIRHPIGPQQENICLEHKV
jgi:hypothetical protein